MFEIVQKNYHPKCFRKSEEVKELLKLVYF